MEIISQFNDVSMRVDAFEQVGSLRVNADSSAAKLLEQESLVETENYTVKQGIIATDRYFNTEINSKTTGDEGPKAEDFDGRTIDVERITGCGIVVLSKPGKHLIFILFLKFIIIRLLF